MNMAKFNANGRLFLTFNGFMTGREMFTFTTVAEIARVMGGTDEYTVEALLNNLVEKELVDWDKKEGYSLRANYFKS
jgi:DNA-binding IclR family transcriptional regulator